MKTLILVLIFSGTNLAFGLNEFSDDQAIRKLISVARDVENEKILEGVTELQACKRQFPVSPNDSGSIDQAQVGRLQSCIRDKFKNRPVQDIERISDQLKLETFELIPSKSTENITKYLTSKLYKSMTGVDINDLEQRNYEKIIKAQKFGTKKMLDQKDFFELYKNQMSKNVIYEISRFCFVDLRDGKRPDSSDTNSAFLDHWNLDNFSNDDGPQDIEPTDTGSPKFELDAQVSSAPDANAAYPDIVRSITGSKSVDSNKLFTFFRFCAKQMNKLCESYESKCKNTQGTNNGCRGENGGKACLSKNRIITFRRALASSDESFKKFAEKSGNDIKVALDPNQTIKLYEGGRGQNEQSYNQLTNAASVDFFKANEGEDYKKAEECVKSNGTTDCEEFSIVDDSVARIEANTEILFTAKREAEMARIRELKNANNQSLTDYLDKNYPDIKVQYDANKSMDLEEAIAQRWDGQREAMIKEIKDRIGTRQLAEATAPTQQVKQDTAVKNAREALNEKSRLAQVVLFNNIISSSLNLVDESGKDAGRNTQTLTNELDTVENEVRQNDLFKGLRTIADSGDPNENQSSTQGNSISDIGFLYELIGVQKEGQGASQRQPAQRGGR